MTGVAAAATASGSMKPGPGSGRTDSLIASCAEKTAAALSAGGHGSSWQDPLVEAVTL